MVNREIAGAMKQLAGKCPYRTYGTKTIRQNNVAKEMFRITSMWNLENPDTRNFAETDPQSF